MIKEKLTEGVKDLISYLAESGMDAESEKVRNLMKRKQMQTNLQEYIEKHEKWNEVSSLAEEIDFEKLQDYMKKEFPEKIDKGFFALKESERTLWRESLIEQICSYMEVETKEARERIKRIICDSLDIVHDFYKRDIKEEDYILMQEFLDALVEKTQETEKEEKVQKDSCINIKFLTNSIQCSSNCVGREKDIEELENLLKTNDRILLSGMGGSGKSTLAEKLFERVRDKYEHIGWMNYTGTMRESILKSFLLYKEKCSEERIELIVDWLCQYGNNTILFIDNVDADFEKDECVQLLNGKVKMFVTSRTISLEGFQTVQIRSESLTECTEIFNSYYKEKRTEEELKEFLSYLDYNILLIELSAKAAKYAEMSLDQYIAQVCESGIDSVHDEIYTNYDKKEDRIIDRILRLYNMQGLPEEQVRILQNFAITPDIQLPFLYREWANLKKKDVIRLVRLGWIKKTDTYYEMHPLIKESIRKQRKISSQCCEDMLKTFYEESFRNMSDEFEINYTKKLIMRSFIDYFWNDYEIRLEDVIHMYGMMCIGFSEYDEAVEILKDYQEMLKKNYPEEKEFIGKFDLSLSFVYFHAYNYEEAEKYLNKVDEMEEKEHWLISDEDKFEYYNCHLVLACKNKDWDKAEEFFKRICEDKTEGYRFVTAVVNMTSGMIERGYCQKALSYMLKYQDEIEKRLKKRPSELAVFYSNLAISYVDIGRLAEAKKYDSEALEIRKRVLGFYNRDTAISYEAMAEDYLEEGELEKAWESVQNAKKICEKIGISDECELYQNILHTENIIGKKMSYYFI